MMGSFLARGNEALWVYEIWGVHPVNKYRGTGPQEAMTKGSDAWYLGNKSKLKVAQGVLGAVADKDSELRFIPYTMHAVKQGFLDLGASSVLSAHELLRSSVLRLEACTGAVQVEGDVHGLVPMKRHIFEDGYLSFSDPVMGYIMPWQQQKLQQFAEILSFDGS